MAVVAIGAAAFALQGCGDDGVVVATTASADSVNMETIVPTTSAVPLTTAVDSTSPGTEVPTTTAPTTTATPVTGATTPSGLLVVFPDSVPDSVCTMERIEADTGLSLLWGLHCEGAWSLGSRDEGSSDPAIESEAADVFRWTGFEWQYRGNHYAMCDVGLVMAGMPPAVVLDIWGEMDSCLSPPTLSPEPSSGPLQWGDQGVRVAALQRALIDRNLLFDGADGQYGSNTEAAVRDLEFLLGLEADGIADAAVFAELAL